MRAFHSIGKRHSGFVLLPAMLIAAALAADAQRALSPSAERQNPEPYMISVNVDLVVLHATVRDRKGRLVPDLREQDFAVYEDGVRQSLRLFRHEDLPVTVGLIIDHSGSMGPKLPEVIAAARTFVRTSNPEDRLFVVNFNERVTLALTDTISFSDRTDALERAISRTPAAGMTALYDALSEGLARLQPGTRDRSVLIAISDGGDNASRHSLAQVIEEVGQSNALIYAIGIADEAETDRNPAVLRRLAAATGGEAFFPEKAAEVVSICERIAHDIRNQYTVGYVSSNPSKAGGYRNIQIVVQGTTKEKLSVRARSGYFAGAGSPAMKQGAGR